MLRGWTKRRKSGAESWSRSATTAPPNYLDRADPGLLFESMMPADLADGPVVALTTSGWNVGEGLDMNRVREFGAGVLAVRASMTGVPGRLIMDIAAGKVGVAAPDAR